MKLLNFKILKLTLCLSVGILFGHIFKIPLISSLVFTFVLFSALSFSFLFSKNQIKKSIWFGLLTFITTFSSGILVYNLHNQQNFKNHFSNYISNNSDDGNVVVLRIREKLKPVNLYSKYIVDVLKVDDKSVSGKSLLNVLIDSTQTHYKVDDILMGSISFKELIHPLNPNQFDYKNYLERQYVYHQIFTENHLLLNTKSKTHTIFGYADQLRELINFKLKQHHFKPDELSIINALLLGQRQDISEEIYNSYTRAGAVHILAVSGLHVGIVLMILSFVLKPVEYIRHGKTIKVLIILIFLWGFAIVAGLSASVTRAVTMFSLVAVAMHWKRPTNIYNTLAISMFILLLFKPMFLFDVGFQLSYLAVLSIVTIQPLLYKIWKPKLKIFDFFWKILTVTIAAQFGIVPISIYYFHQFPSLFFISNLAIIPFLGFILGLGIIVIFLAVLNILPEILASIYGQTITAMNLIVNWVSSQEQFLFKNISITLLQVIACYLIIIAFVKFTTHKSFVNLRLLLIAVLILQSVFIYTAIKYSNEEFILFHKSRHSLIGLKNGKKLYVYHDLDRLAMSKDKMISNFKIGNFIAKMEQDSIKSVYQIKDKNLLVVDSFGIYAIKSFKTDYVLLRNSPKINLNRLIDSLQPKMVIADGSNYKSYVNRWENTCKNKKLLFHSTSEKGAFIIK